MSKLFEHFFCWTKSYFTHFRGARYITDFDGRYIFCIIFHEDSKNMIFFKIGHAQSTPKLCLAWLLIKTEQASWAAEKNRSCVFGVLIWANYLDGSAKLWPCLNGLCNSFNRLICNFKDISNNKRWMLQKWKCFVLKSYLIQ